MNGEDEAFDRGRAEGYAEGKEEGRKEAINEIWLKVNSLIDEIRLMS